MRLLRTILSCSLLVACSSSTPANEEDSGPGDGGLPGTDASTNGDGGGGGDDSGGGGGTDGAVDGGVDAGNGRDGGVDAGVDGGHVITSTCAPSNILFSASKSSPLTDPASAFLPSNVAAADMNGDGKADLVVLIENAGVGVEVLLSNGDGTFQAGKLYSDPVGNGFGMAIGDFVGSGHNDVLVSSFGNGGSVDNYADVLPNDGTGTLGAPVSSNVGWENVATLAPGDFNGDGKLDVAYVGQDNAGTSLNGGGGMFGQFSTKPPLTTGFAVGDLNGDGVADAVVVDSTKGACVYLNSGNAQFAAPVCYAPLGNSGPDTAAIGDIDGDGKNDIIAVYTGSGGVENSPNINAYLNKGSGTFSAYHVSTLKEILSDIHLVDVNNDGKADLVANNTYEAPAHADVLLSNGDGTFAATVDQYSLGGISSYTFQPLAIGDFAGNGLRGMASLDVSTNTVDVVIATCKP